MKYLILGSEGQVGGELCKYLKSLNHEVIEFDITKDHRQDLRVKNSLQGYIESCDFVFFLAFDVGGSRYLKKYQKTFEFIDNNTKLLTYTFDQLKIHKKPFIFASSQMSNMSYSPYGICKSLGEIYTNSLNGLVVKFWNVYGPEKDLEKSHVITDFILKAKEGKITMLTDGEEERQFLHAEDCSSALLILSENYNKIDREKNLHITNFEWNKIIDVANIIKNRIPCDVQKSEQKDDVQQNKKNEPDPYILNFWNPKINLVDGINKIIDDML